MCEAHRKINIVLYLTLSLYAKGRLCRHFLHPNPLDMGVGCIGCLHKEKIHKAEIIFVRLKGKSCVCPQLFGLHEQLCWTFVNV